MAGNDPVDQDAIAAQWEAALDSEDPVAAAGEASSNELTESMALQWAAMVEDGSRDFGGGKNGGERVLSQEEIDNLLGFTAGEVNLDENSGIRAIIDSAMVSYERLPMLEIVFDRLVRLMTTSLRNFTSDNVEVSLDRITSVRFGDYLNSIPLPAILAVFKADVIEKCVLQILRAIGCHGRAPFFCSRLARETFIGPKPFACANTRRPPLSDRCKASGVSY